MPQSRQSLSLDQTYYTIRKAGGVFVSRQNGLSVLAGARPKLQSRLLLRPQAVVRALLSGYHQAVGTRRSACLPASRRSSIEGSPFPAHSRSLDATWVRIVVSDRETSAQTSSRTARSMLVVERSNKITSSKRGFLDLHSWDEPVEFQQHSTGNIPRRMAEK
jgi:hypothetical protein